MTKRVAAIDLGTNTFHLLIAELGTEGYRERVRRVDPVKLGEGGINKGRIEEQPFQRGLAMLAVYARICKEHGVSEIHAIGTSAIRNAKNGKEFAKRVFDLTGIVIRIIDGNEEAQYIYRGVRSAGCLDEQLSLIMDIGGGSVEFILCTRNAIAWKQSFEIGAARLMGLFHQTDPMPAENLRQLTVFLEEKLAPLFAALAGRPVHRLIGSSGAFETFAEMIDLQFDIGTTIRYSFDFARLAETLGWLISSSHQQRAAHGRIIPLRVDMVVSAAVVTEFILKTLQIQEVTMTAYSLKEGVMEWALGQ